MAENNGPCNVNSAAGKTAMLIVRCGGGESDSDECKCQKSGTDCSTCMAEDRCVWKSNTCKATKPSVTEKKRRRIKLGGS